MTRAVVVVLALGLVAGCKKAKEDAAPAGADKPPPIVPEQRQRDGEACQVYVERVCTCAAQKPDNAELAERCKYDKALPEALTMSLSAADSPESTKQDIQRAQRQYRKIATNCLESTAKLDALGCP